MSTVSKDKEVQLKPIATLGNWCVRLMFVMVFLELVSFGTLLNEYRLAVIDEPFPGFASEEAYFQAFDLAVELDSLSYFAYFLVGSISFSLNVFWIFRSTHNAAVIDPKPGRISKWMALLYNFIPFVNWWMPFRAVTQVWHSSLGNNDPLNLRAPTFFWAWWICWIIYVSITQGSSDFMGYDASDSYLKGLQANIFKVPFGVVTFYVFARIIRRITDAQSAALDSNLGRAQT
ncbi:MAG: DUF4328 domain-containing protein [Paracoccaceae bacterium]